MAKFEVVVKKSALKQLRRFPKSIQRNIQDSMVNYLDDRPDVADGTHIKKLTDGYRLRVGSYRVFYDIESLQVTVTSIVRRTSTTY